jgi:tetratricopeptide (TPR) repeat protein
LHPPYLLSKSIALDDNNWATYGLRGGAYLRINKYNLAVSDLSKAAKINNRSDDVYLLMCVAYIYKGQYKQAISDCDAALRINPKSIDATNARREAQGRLAEPRIRRVPSPQPAQNSAPSWFACHHVLGAMGGMMGCSPW